MPSMFPLGEAILGESDRGRERHASKNHGKPGDVTKRKNSYCEVVQCAGNALRPTYLQKEGQTQIESSRKEIHN